MGTLLCLRMSRLLSMPPFCVMEIWLFTADASIIFTSGMRILRLKSKKFLCKIFWKWCRDTLKSRFRVEGSWESSDLLYLNFGN